MTMRTNYCGQINAGFVGQEVKLCGWVNKIRNHGKVIFINLRDREGIVQVVINNSDPEIFALGEKIHNEYVIGITGIVFERPKDLINPEMATGEIEVVASAVKIFNVSESLPFVTDQIHNEANEELRLKYRYLDLRRPEMIRNLVIRSQVATLIRNYLNELGFIEIETPMLTKSTPEGARDYLVPSRNFPGQFYALPQSPQIFKQLLMAAGLDRYYQIVRCFRDEDLRADRQPEFTQLDIEASFIDEIEIQQINEELFRKLFAEILNVALPNPFPRMTYREAILRYGTDRPDLRIPLELIDIGDLVATSSLEAFANAAKDSHSRVAAIRLRNGASLTRKQLDFYGEFITKYGARGLATIKVLDRTKVIEGVQTSLLKFLDQEAIDGILKRVNAENKDLIFIMAGKAKVTNEALGALRVKLGHDLNLVEHAWKPLWVVDFPMFEQQDDGAWTFLHHPFTSPKESDPAKLVADPGASLARAYDLVMNGSELGGGSIRIDNLPMQMAVFKILGFSEENAKKQFGHLLEAFKYGYPPEGGIAFGLDRIVATMTGSESIRDVIAFPKTTTASCLMTEAPSKVSLEQLQELGIRVTPIAEKSE